MVLPLTGLLTNLVLTKTYFVLYNAFLHRYHNLALILLGLPFELSTQGSFLYIAKTYTLDELGSASH